MSIADLFHSISLMLPPEERIWCEIQGFLLQLSAISSVLWSSIIAYSLYDTVLLENSNVDRYEKYFIIIGYLIPLILAIIPQTLGAYNSAFGWCWIKSSFIEDLILRLSCFYIIIWAVMIFNVIVYIKVIMKIQAEYGNIMGDHTQHKMLMRRLSLYPLILVITYIPISFKRITEIFDPSDVPFWLTCLAAIGISLTGFCNAIVYGLTGPVKNALWNLCSDEERTQSAYSLYTVNTEGFNTNSQ